ncbi:MAG: hypothetical protein AB8H86_19395 [Polyangiales bacterium]
MTGLTRVLVCIVACGGAVASHAVAQDEGEPIERILDIGPDASPEAVVASDRSPGERSTASQFRDLSTSLAEMIREVDERQRGFSLALELGGSLLTPLVDFSTRSITVNVSIQAAYHIPDWAFVVSVENARWRAPELGSRIWQTALNVGFGIARYHRSGLLRTMLLVGPSILTRANNLDPAGSVGLYVDVRPLGFSWRFSERASLVADLLYMTLVAPVLTGVPLIDFQFRSSVGIEAIF